MTQIDSVAQPTESGRATSDCADASSRAAVDTNGKIAIDTAANKTKQCRFIVRNL